MNKRIETGHTHAEHRDTRQAIISQLTELRDEWQMSAHRIIAADYEDGGLGSSDRKNKFRGTWFTIVGAAVEQALASVGDSPAKRDLNIRRKALLEQYKSGHAQGLEAYEHALAPQLQAAFAAKGVSLSAVEAGAVALWLKKDPSGTLASTYLLDEVPFSRAAFGAIEKENKFNIKKIYSTGLEDFCKSLYSECRVESLDETHTSTDAALVEKGDQLLTDTIALLEQPYEIERAA